MGFVRRRPRGWCMGVGAEPETGQGKPLGRLNPAEVQSRRIRAFSWPPRRVFFKPPCLQSLIVLLLMECLLWPFLV